MIGREPEEWIGATPDSAIPPRVKLRVFERAGGVCHISGRKIRPGDLWDCDHVVALCNGGENRETNLAPALRDHHREKTASDVKQRAVEDRKRKKHLGLHKPKTIMPGSRASKWKKKADGTTVLRGAE